MAKHRDDEELNIEILPPEEVIAEQEKASGRKTVPFPASSMEEAPDEQMQETERAGILKRFHMLSLRRHKLAVRGLIAAIVIVIVLIGVTVVRRWSYHSYKIIATQTVDNAISSEYCSIGGNVLRYGTDGASLISRSQSVIWDVNYRMDVPKVSVCGTTAAIFDSDGSSIVICDETGEKGSISTDMPIVRVDVSNTGTVAALLGEGSNSNFIRYYKSSGEEIASIKTSINEPGYPMDIALSDDGMMLAVSYLSYADNTMKSLIRFYNFDDIGQNQMDNRVGQYEMEDTLIPEIEYLSETTAVAFKDKGFVIFEGDTVPEKKEEIKITEEIESIFYNERYIGLVLDNRADAGQDETVSAAGADGGTSASDASGSTDDNNSGAGSAGSAAGSASAAAAFRGQDQEAKDAAPDEKVSGAAEEKPFILNVYDLNGRELARKPMDLMFETVEFSGNQISFYNKEELCVFGLDGTEKYRGSYEEHPRQFFAVDTKLYVAADEDGITWLRLR